MLILDWFPRQRLHRWLHCYLTVYISCSQSHHSPNTSMPVRVRFQARRPRWSDLRASNEDKEAATQTDLIVTMQSVE